MDAAVAWMRDNLFHIGGSTVFGTGPRAAEVRFFRAEILYYKLGKFEEAGDEYLAVGKTAPVGKYHKGALLNAMSVEYPKTHDPAPIFAQAVRERGIGVDDSVLGALAVLSQELANIRGPAFCQDTVVTDAQARDWVQRVERVLHVGDALHRRLRAVG